MRLLLWPILLLFSLFARADDLLDPEQAFQFSARLSDPGRIEVSYRIAEGYYLYRERFQFSTDSPEVKLGAPVFPPGKIKQDEFFGRVETYRGSLTVTIPIVSGAGQPFTLRAQSQGCADVGVCYPPQTQTVLLTAGPGDAGTDGAWYQGTQDPERAEGLLRGGRFWLMVAGFFGFGLALAFTPCVLPMIPILSGIIAGQGAGLTRYRGFVLSAAYVLGMAITYSAAGVAAGLSGALISSALQNAWVLGAFALVFVALALSMFGLFDLQVPASVQNRASNVAARLPGGRVTGVFLMGALSALIVSPCVAAPLAGALLYISQTRDVVLGGTALFAMALGMGVPLLLVGVSAGALLPRTGPWMDEVKKFFGVLLLAVAVWIVSPVIPVAAQMLAWAALLIVSAIYLRAIDPLPAGASALARLWKGVGVIALVAGVSLLVGALSGSRDLLQPLAGLRGSAVPGAASPVHFERIRSLAELEQRLAQTERPVMLDFYADWCVSCKEMEQFTFADPRIQARLQDLLLLQVDVTDNTAEDRALLKRFGLFGPPGIIFFDADGNELKQLRVVGYQPADQFLVNLDKALESGPQPRTLTWAQ